jgi:hypothetical protein
MKQLFTLLALIFISSANAQENEFVLGPEKMTDYIVIPFEGKTQQELYKKSLQWIEFAYKNPKEVLKGNIENEYIRFQGSKKGLIVMNALGKHYYDGRYTIEISFKDGKCKFDIIEIEYYTPYSQYNPGGWNLFGMNNTSAYFKKGELRSNCKYFTEIPQYFNSLKDEFIAFMKSDNLPTKNSEW